MSATLKGQNLLPKNLNLIKMFSLFLFFSFCLPNFILTQQLDFVCSQCGTNFGNYAAFKEHFHDGFSLPDHFKVEEEDNSMSYFMRDPMQYLNDIGNGSEAVEGSSHGEAAEGSSHGEAAKRSSRWDKIARFLRGKQKHSAHPPPPLPPPPPPRANQCSHSHHLPHCVNHHHLPQETSNPTNQILFFNTPTPHQQATFFNQYCTLKDVNVNNRWWGFDFLHWGNKFKADGKIWKPISIEKVKGDGHCLFSAIALALMGHVECGFVFRACVDHPEDEGVGKDEHSIRHGEIEDIIVLVKFYKVNIVIFYEREHKSDWLFYSPKSENEHQMRYDPEYPTIPLVLKNAHYDVITGLNF